MLAANKDVFLVANHMRRAWYSSCKDYQSCKRVTRLDRVPKSAVVRPDETFEVINCDAIGPFEQRSPSEDTVMS